MRNIDFNKYQSALIIGNGFDLSLGLSTSYMDFVNSDEFQILLNMQNQLAIYLKVNAELQNHSVNFFSRKLGLTTPRAPKRLSPFRKSAFTF